MRALLRSPFRSLLAVALSATATLALLEIGLRALPVTAYEWRMQQVLPGLKKEIVYSRNRFGLRSRSMTTRAKPPGTIRVICLGASATDQPTQNTEDTWCGRLESALGARFSASGVRIETAAYGRGGFRAADVLHWADDSLDVFEPDVLVTLQGINDLSWNGYPGYAYTPGETRPTRARSAWRLLRRNSRIVQNVEPIVQRLRHRSTVEWHSANLATLSADLRSYPYRETLERDPDPIVEFGDSVAALLRLASAAQIETVVLAQPVLWRAGMSEAEQAVLWFPAWTPSGPVRVDPGALAREMKRYNRTQEKLAAEHRARFVPVDELLEPTLENFIDDCHLTDLGSARLAEIVEPHVADAIARVLERRGSLPLAAPDARGGDAGSR